MPKNQSSDPHLENQWNFFKCQNLNWRFSENEEPANIGSSKQEAMIFSVVTFWNLWKKEKEGAKDAKVFLFAIDYFHLLQKYI
jgi:hypothetical protein